MVTLARDGEDAVLTVRDEGQGMDQEALANAFVPFWRGRDSGTGGTGLGLFLVRELVQAHGGTVEASSAGIGRGSAMTVRLPWRGGEL
jgi:signal transduction histidine kinase